MRSSTAPAHFHQSSSKPVLIPQQSLAPDPATTNEPSRGPVITVLRQYLLLCDATSAELDKAFIAHKDRVL